MSVAVEVLDCTQCRSAGAVEGGACQVCDATLEVPLRFTDVVEEIRLIASLAERENSPTSEAVAHACARAEALLGALRNQFRTDVIGSGGQR